MSVSPSNHRVAMVFSARIDSLQPSVTPATAAAAVAAPSASSKSRSSRRRMTTGPSARSRPTGYPTSPAPKELVVVMRSGLSGNRKRSSRDAWYGCVM